MKVARRYEIDLDFTVLRYDYFAKDMYFTVVMHSLNELH